MDLALQLAYNPSAVRLLALLLALIGGITFFLMLAAIFFRPKGKPKQAKQAVKSVRQTQLQGVQARLDRAQIEISAAEYVKRSLILGIPLGVGLFLLIGSIVLAGIGIIAGFVITWTRLEQARDVKMVRYNKQLANACDIIRTAYGVNPSLKKALDAVAEYSRPPLKEDFQEILVAASQERFVQGLQAVADRRRSIVFDAVATSLMRANEATGEVDEMLRRLAESTRRNVAAFEEAITSQINARSNVQWGTYGPWLIFCVFRVLTILIAFTGGGFILAPMSTFFSTIAGNLVVLIAALVSVLLYRYCLQISQRGLVVRRVKMTEAPVRLGQRPIDSLQDQNLISAQTRPVVTN
jgi:Flp pilus assembly protein TadB